MKNKTSKKTKLFFGVSFLFFVIFVVSYSVRAQSVAGDYWMYVGSYTNTTAKGIYAARFDSKTGGVSPLQLVAEDVFPAQVWATPDGRFLYAANWQGDDTRTGDTITAFAIDRQTGKLTLLNKVSCAGSGPNQVVVDPSGKMAVAVNYRSGTVAAFAIQPDGKLSDAFYVDQHAGPVNPPSKQPGPRAHGVEFDGASRYAYVADIGIDRVYSYRIDPVHRTMAPVDPPYVAQKAGSGPRRLQMHPNQKFLYLARETDSAVTVFRVDDGRLTQLQEISTLPDGYAGRTNTVAEIQIRPDGKFLYVSNRGGDTVAVYSVNAATGLLTIVDFAPAGGRTPRNFRIDPTGKYLFTSNQNSENIVEFRIDERTGKLTPTGHEQPLANPGSIFFVPQTTKTRKHEGEG